MQKCRAPHIRRASENLFQLPGSRTGSGGEWTEKFPFSFQYKAQCQTSTRAVSGVLSPDPQAYRRGPPSGAPATFLRREVEAGGFSALPRA